MSTFAGFDASEPMYSGSLNPDEPRENAEYTAALKQFKDFLRQFHEGNFNYKYRDALKQNYNVGQDWIDINLEDLAAFDELLAEKLYKKPTEYLSIFEVAAREVVDEITAPRPKLEATVRNIQVLLSSDSNASSLRGIKPDSVAQLVKVSGMIISASFIRSKATKIKIQCRSCKEISKDIEIKPGLEGYTMPRKCTTENAGRVQQCPLDPYFIMPDKCTCVDYQTFKLQELPEDIPQGEMPRHLMLYCDRYLCDRIVPGNKVLILGIFCIKKVPTSVKKAGSKDNALVGVRTPYIHVVGVTIEGDGSGKSIHPVITNEEEDYFRRLAADPNIYERIAKSIAPSIFGADDMKKAVACMLFGGSRKRMPDGLCRRGDINVLFLGDPGTAKSQLLKFVEKASPIGVYTSGKGSSAAGLTASVTRDPATRNFVMEGGAMVLADGGVVCIDEFDKMKEDDRVAIHEAMEQQTISIAKAGITTTLNTRCSILAAANSNKGRWDDLQGDDNIDFMPTILSRFDMIFIVKDAHEEDRDITLARHVLQLHANAGHITEQHVEGELSLNTLRKFIRFCKKRCGPRLSPEAGKKLKNQYVMMRKGIEQQEVEGEKRLSIPITVRQLEAIIRISESLAKMRLEPFVTDVHVNEALRLFKVSTITSAMSGNLAGAEGFSNDENHETLNRLEKKMKTLFPIGNQVSVDNITKRFHEMGYESYAITKVLQTMLGRGELQRRLQGKILYRLK